MAQKLWRVVRGCVELGMRNPIQQIHDQGAGGNCNVVRLLSLPCSLSAALRSAQACSSSLNLRGTWRQPFSILLQAA